MDCDKITLKNIGLTINETKILSNVNLSIVKNKLTIIKGNSGSGKTSLLNIMNFLYEPTEGDIYYDGCKVDIKDSKKIDLLRNEEIAFFHQELALIENISFYESLKLFASIKSTNLLDEDIYVACQSLGISDLLHKDISVMSGGERQRAAFIKLMVLNYSLILIDEPTNNLDSLNVEYIINEIDHLKKQEDLTIVIVTHSEDLLHLADKIYQMEEINLA
jgi:putative ABC transport system ATP-binding protein